MWKRWRPVIAYLIVLAVSMAALTAVKVSSDDARDRDNQQQEAQRRHDLDATRQQAIDTCRSGNEVRQALRDVIVIASTPRATATPEQVAAAEAFRNSTLEKVPLRDCDALPKPGEP